MAIALAASFLVLLLASPTVYGADYTVGDTAGWSLSGDYTNWPTGKTFRVGDNLVFNYDSSHKVDIVNQNDYNSCSSGNALKSYQDGNTKIALTSPGSMYFICPSSGHCSSGMKLQINVVAASNTPSTPSGTPSNASPPSGSGTPATTTPAAPKNNGVASVSGGFTHLMGSLFVSAIILAFMG